MGDTEHCKWGNGPGGEANARSRGGLIDKIFFNKSVFLNCFEGGDHDDIRAVYFRSDV